MTTGKIRDGLAGAKLTAGLDDAMLDALSDIGVMHHFAKGSPIFALGEPANHIYVVVEGSLALALPVKINGQLKDIAIDEKGPGAAVAWSALVEPHRFTLSGRAATDVTLVQLGRAAVHDLLQRRPDAACLFMRNLCQVVGSRVMTLEALLMRDMQRWVDLQQQAS